jgi:hypothetical protein
MPPREFVTLNAACLELASKWGIPLSVTEQIVRAVLQGGACFVRGRSRFDLGPRDISREIGPTLLHGSLISLDFTDVEIGRNDLLKLGRELVPTEWEYLVSAAEAEAEDAELEPLRSNDEIKACNYLKQHLEADHNIKRDDAWKSFGARFPTLTKHAFRTRVWPHARRAAGLGASAPPGPKKQNRKTYSAT